jgi:dipeptidyl aminopeptidase/acylaminoacyl peptidase
MVGFTREDVEFISKGTRCAAWLYLPKGIKKPPAVIMGHGFAAERGFALPAFAERFVGRGLAVFLFDYRSFGASDGTPRNLVNPFRHVTDWKAALAHVRTLDAVDTERIALWGSSFGGGHVIVTAAVDRKVSAVVAQVPMVDGLSSLFMIGPANMAKGLYYGARDLLRMVTFREPFYAPVVAEPGTFAAMNAPGAKEGYLAIVPEDSTWENRCPARIGLIIGLYQPIRFSERVKCPALIVMAERENLVSLRMTRRAAKRMKRGVLKTVPGGHFDVYTGENFERVVKIEGDFLVEHLSEG